MKKWVKIDRATGNAIKYKKEKEIQRVLNKKYVWLEEVQGVRPSYDPDTERLKQVINQPDLSDLNINVDPSTVRQIDYQVLALTQEQIDQKTVQKIASTDKGLIRAIEDVLVLIAQGTPLNKANLPQSVIEKVNERRGFRGEQPV